MRRNERREHGLIYALFDGLLSLIDGLCGLIVRIAAGIARFAGRLLSLLLHGLACLVRGTVKAISYPFILFFRFLFRKRNRAQRCLALTGEEFEDYCALILKDNGFRSIEMTPVSGDQGVDILAVRQGESWAIQCKNYHDAVGNFAVQEACAGREYYGCDRAAVLCPTTYTRAAKELAASTEVDLWDGEVLSRMMKKSGRVPRHKK